MRKVNYTQLAFMGVGILSVHLIDLMADGAAVSSSALFATGIEAALGAGIGLFIYWLILGRRKLT